MTTQTRAKSPLQILNARIAECYVQGRTKPIDLFVTIPLWVAEELKQALEKQ